ncbi:ABC transporter substrate-binding protein [Paenibacillus sp. MBLB4367]|uniref:ABC transporter substrate-binding protein n=1 Tax=Paenibacillus sp. MBLB4367 TaxID=3384767 RepID=UPI0039084257
MKQHSILVFFLVMFCFLLSGCNKSDLLRDEKVGQQLHVTEQKNLKVVYYSESSFMQYFGKSLTAKYPDIAINVISPPPFEANRDMKQVWASFLENQKPDILTGFNDYYEHFVENEWLENLDPFIKQDRFDINNIHPGVIAALRKRGNGKLYALSPTFSSRALYYNKDLFNQYKIPYPKDQMTWDEVLELAKQFRLANANSNGIYGLYIDSTNPYYLIDRIASTNSLSLTDSKGENLLIDSDPWKKVWKSVSEGYKAGYIFSPTDKEFGDGNFKNNRFIMGTAAMTVDIPKSVLLNDEIRKQLYKLFNWDMVTEPVNPSLPEESNSFNVSSFFSVNAKSTNKKGAWEVVKYLNSDEFAQIYAKLIPPTSLLSRTAHIKTSDGRNWQAFFKLKPSTYSDMFRNTPKSFQEAYKKLLSDKANEAIKEDQNADDILHSLQESGQKLLTEANKEKKNNK